MLDMIGKPTAENTYATLNDKIRLDAHIGAVVGQAQFEKRAAQPATPVPVSRQAADIKTHRAFERAAEQRRAVVTSPVAEQHTTSSSATAPPSSSVVEAYAGERGGEVLSLLGRLRNKGNRP